MSEGNHTGVHAYAFKKIKKQYCEEVSVLLEYVCCMTAHTGEVGLLRHTLPTRLQRKIFNHTLEH